MELPQANPDARPQTENVYRDSQAEPPPPMRPNLYATPAAVEPDGPLQSTLRPAAPARSLGTVSRAPAAQGPPKSSGAEVMEAMGRQVAAINAALGEMHAIMKAYIDERNG